MIIHLSPQLSSAPVPSVFVTGDTITVDGVEFDFSDLTDPVEPGAPFIAPVYREGEHVVVALVLPHGADPTPEQTFPEPIEVVDGEVLLPTAPPEPEPAPPTPEQIMAELTAEVQSWLDGKARERNYDGILSLCTYATDPDPVFAAEGQAGITWRSAVWRTCYQILAEVMAEDRPVPTREELLAELPDITWPEDAV